MTETEEASNNSTRVDILRLGRKSVAYVVGYLATRAISFLLLPLYTNALSPADYGVLSLAFTFTAFSLIIFHMGLDSALLKFFTGEDHPRKQQVFTTIFLFQLVMMAIFGSLLILFREPLAPLVLGAPRTDWLLLLIGIIFADTLWAYPMHILRAEERATRYASFSLLNAVITMGGNIALVAGFKMGVTGALVSNLAASSLLILVNLPTVVRYFSWGNRNHALLKSVLKFGLPFLPAGIFTMIMELADRYLLRWLTDIETVGLYSAGYKLGLAMLLLVSGFSLGWQPFFLRRGKESGAQVVFARITTYTIAILGWVLITLIAWVDELVRLPFGSITLFGPDYWSAVSFVPLVLMGYFFFAMYVLQLPGIHLTSNTKWVILFRGVGAATNIGLNLYLIPRIGAMGSALATCGAFAVMALVTFLSVRRFYSIPYEWLRLLRIGILLILGLLIFYQVPESLGRDLGLTILIPIGMLLLGGTTEGERVQLLRLLRIK